MKHLTPDTIADTVQTLCLMLFNIGAWISIADSLLKLALTAASLAYIIYKWSHDIKKNKHNGQGND